MDGLAQLSATRLSRLLRSGEVSAEDAVRAALARIEALDDRLQAFVTVDRKGAISAARAADARRRRGDLPPLHGMPVAVKDVTATAGLRTTQGSLLHRETVPERDEESVARLRAAGVIVIGKTNTPEFAFGAVCTNALRGPTCNPWDLSLTSAGSSGGSAVAVASGMVPLAQGTDFGGSVRTPASFCGVVGLRPAPGTIPEPGRALPWGRLATQGVLARSVPDALLMLQAMAGPHPLDPTSALAPARRRPAGVPLVAASVDLGGAFPVDPGVRSAFDGALRDAGALVGPIVEAAPDASGGVEAFKILRAAESWLKFGALVEAEEARLTPSFVWNVRRGRDITAEQYLRADVARGRVWRNFMGFFDKVDVLMLPSASVLPFPNAQGEVGEVGGQPCETIIDYLACTFLVSLVGFPALSLPAPVAPGALPFGVQLVARPGNEAQLYSVARRLERGGFRHRWPPLARRAEAAGRGAAA